MYIKHERQCLNTFPNTSKIIVLSTLFLVFGIVAKLNFLGLIYYVILRALLNKITQDTICNRTIHCLVIQRVCLFEAIIKADVDESINLANMHMHYMPTMLVQTLWKHVQHEALTSSSLSCCSKSSSKVLAEDAPPGKNLRRICWAKKVKNKASCKRMTWCSLKVTVIHITKTFPESLMTGFSKFSNQSRILGSNSSVHELSKP